MPPRICRIRSRRRNMFSAGLFVAEHRDQVSAIVIYFLEIIYCSSSFFLFSPLGRSFFSSGIRYSPDAHFPRSIRRQRSEQKGLNGLSSQRVSFLQTGQLIFFSFMTDLLTAIHMRSAPRPSRSRRASGPRDKACSQKRYRGYQSPSSSRSPRVRRRPAA